MIDRFINALQDAGLVLSDQELADLSEAQSVLHDEDIADILWLTSHIGLPPEPEDLEEPAAGEGQNGGSTSTVEVIEIDDSESTLGTESAVAPPPTPTVSATVPNAAGAEDTQNIDMPETGLPLQVQAAPALPNSRAMGRALRPLMRKVPSRTRQVLDELATVDRIAKEDVWIPVLKPEPERWFELELVIESSPFSFVWESTLSEFHRVLEQEGAFRSVRTWWVEDAAAGTPKLISKTIPKGVERSSTSAFSGDAISRSPRELIDASGRALVLYVSDCRSPLWQQGRIHEWLKLWSQHQPTTLVQLLPERLWTETELNTGFKIQTSAFTPGVANTDLQVHNPPARRGLTTANTLTLPIVTLTASSMLQWARVVTAAGQQRLPARLFDMNWVRSDTRKQETNWDAIEPQTPEALIELFNATASDPAKRLARLMSVVPVELPVVHLLQRTFFGEDADPVHVAEVFDSCLMQPVGKPKPGEALRYDFVPGVRDLLNPVNPIDETLDVLDTLSKEIARTLGFEIRSFTALLYPNADWDEKEKAAILPFAQIATEVLHRLGGQYADLAQQVERDAREQELQTQAADVEAETEPAEPTFPELRTIEFLKAELIDEADGPAVEDSPAPRRINEAGLELIKSFEGLQLDARPDAVGEWTIGHGHTSAMGPPEVVKGMRITPDEAEAILREDLQPFEQAVESALTIETTDDQFAALVSFAFNVGIESFASSTLLRKHNAGDFAGVADEFLRWTIAGGQEPPGLVRRREAERALYLSQEPSSPSESDIELITDEFDIATITLEAEPEDTLETFEFQVATLRQRSQAQNQQQGLFDRLFNRPSAAAEWVIEKRRGQARRFIEVLRGKLSRAELYRILSELPEDRLKRLIDDLTPPRSTMSAIQPKKKRIDAFLDFAKNDSSREPSLLQKILEAPGVISTQEHSNLHPKIEMVYVPGGTFTMGSPANELERSDAEGPQHEVTVQTFFMGQYPVTQAQWRFVAGLEQINRELNPDPSNFKGDNRPVERVSWYEAVEFCDRLSRHTGRDYRLPTEAEWEYACRAGTTSPFAFGETLTTDLANYDGSYAYGPGPKGEYRQKTTPVDYFNLANAFGLVDMHGNVYEWCQDHWHDSYAGAPDDGSAWLSEDENAPRVRRGGSWFSFPRNCRSAYRLSYVPDNRHDGIGFRIVCRAPRTLG